MLRVLRFLLACLVLQIVDSKMVLTDVRSHGNPEYANFSTILYKGPKGESFMNCTLATRIEMVKMMGNFMFSVPKDANDKDYQNQLLKSSFDICKIHKGVRANFLISMVMENLYKSSDVSLQCPFKARSYHVWNWQLDENVVPKYLILGNMKFVMTVRVHSKAAKMKIPVYFFALKFYAEFRKED